MTVGKLAQILKENNIPEDAVMLSDSGWECCATDMDGVYYNEETNELVFTQNVDKYEHRYYNKPEWKLLYPKEAENDVANCDLNDPWDKDKVFDCKFCHTIYSDEDANDIIFSRGKYFGLKTPDEFISLCENGTYDINIDTGDPYESGILENVKFCPYCGRRLAK